MSGIDKFISHAGASGKTIFNIFLVLIVLFVIYNFLTEIGIKLYKTYYGMEGLSNASDYKIVKSGKCDEIIPTSTECQAYATKQQLGVGKWKGTMGSGYYTGLAQGCNKYDDGTGYQFFFNYYGSGPKQLDSSNADCTAENYCICKSPAPPLQEVSATVGIGGPKSIYITFSEKINNVTILQNSDFSVSINGAAGVTPNGWIGISSDGRVVLDSPTAIRFGDAVTVDYTAGGDSSHQIQGMDGRTVPSFVGAEVENAVPAQQGSLCAADYGGQVPVMEFKIGKHVGLNSQLVLVKISQ